MPLEASLKENNKDPKREEDKEKKPEEVGGAEKAPRKPPKEEAKGSEKLTIDSEIEEMEKRVKEAVRYDLNKNNGTLDDNSRVVFGPLFPENGCEEAGDEKKDTIMHKIEKSEEFSPKKGEGLEKIKEVVGKELSEEKEKDQKLGENKEEKEGSALEIESKKSIISSQEELLKELSYGSMDNNMENEGRGEEREGGAQNGRFQDEPSIGDLIEKPEVEKSYPAGDDVKSGKKEEKKEVEVFKADEERKEEEEEIRIEREVDAEESAAEQAEMRREGRPSTLIRIKEFYRGVGGKIKLIYERTRDFLMRVC